MTTSAAALAPLVDALVASPLEDVPVAELQERIAAVTPQVARLQGWLQAAVGQLHAACAGEVPTPDGGRRSAAGWLADVRRSTASAAGRDLRISAALRSLPAVVEAVLDGVLTPEQAAVLSRLVGRIDVGGLTESQPDLIAVAARMDPVQMGAWVAHLVATHCEPALDAAAERGRDRRFWQTSRDADGSLRGRFVLAGEDSEVILTVLEPLARKQGLGDGRSAGQRRADAVVEVFGQVLRFGDLPDAGGQRPHLSYVLPADWAAAQSARAACRDCGPRCDAHRPVGFLETVAAGLPDGRGAAAHAASRVTATAGRPAVAAEHACATAAWTGPQTRARIETVLCDTRISRVLLDGLGQVTGLESLTDSVTPAQRRALAARDLGCAARGCTRPPALCDAHHLLRRADGGPTALSNLVLLCRRHHVLWHLGEIGLRDLHVPWHPDARAAAGPPDWGDDRFAAHTGA